MRKRLLEKMYEGEFVISIQIDPPTTADFSQFADMVRELMEHGVELVDVNSSRRLSYDSLALAMELSRWGLEVIPHVTTRESSIEGLLKQILTAYSIGGVRNFLVITGDPHESPHPKGVFHTDSVGAIEALNKRFRENPLECLDIDFAAAVNQNEDLEKEAKRVLAKVATDTDFFMSQPVFSEAQALHLFEWYDRCSLEPLLVGVWPLTNWKTIEAIRRGVITGVVLPDEIYEEAAHYQADAAKLEKWGLEKAEALTKFLCGHKREKSGIYIVAPFRNPLSIMSLFEKVIRL